MRKTFETIALWKKLDIVFQCLLFILMIFVIAFEECSLSSLFGLYIMGLAQLISSIAWILYLKRNDIPAMNGSMQFRVAIVIIATVIALSILLNVLVFILLSLTMIVIGPFLCINYFLLTLNELKYYSNARKPYYLL